MAALSETIEVYITDLVNICMGYICTGTQHYNIPNGTRPFLIKHARKVWPVTKISVPRQNWSPRTDFRCQNWSPVKTWIYNNLAIHGPAWPTCSCCSDCHCSYRPYTSYTQCTTDLVSRARPFSEPFLNAR